MGVGTSIQTTIPFHSGLFLIIIVNYDEFVKTVGDKIRLIFNPIPQIDDDSDVVMVDRDQIFPTNIYGWSRINTGITLEDKGTTLTHDGASGGQDALVLIQWHRPISRRFFCFQLEILTVFNAVAIGLASQDYQCDQFPGWRSNSIAYHSDDGKCFHATGSGMQYGPTCTEGDIMTLWVIFNPKNEFAQNASLCKVKDVGGGKASAYYSSDSESHVSDSDSETEEDTSREEIHVEFLKNNKRLGKIKTKIPKGGYFPTIGLMKRGEKIRVNMQPYSG